MNWRDLECQTINPCIGNSLYSHLFLINNYCLFVCLFELINKCSTFVFFDLIRKCGRQTNDGRQGLQTNVGRKTATQELRRLQRIEYHYRDCNGNRGKTKRSCTIQRIASNAHYSTLRKVWKEWSDSDNKVWNLRG